jgi:2-methylcitrate dehydratase PrpD
MPHEPLDVTRRLAGFVASTGFDDLPVEVVDAARLACLNIVGTCLGGFQTRIGKLHVELAKELGGGQERATIMGDGARVSVPAAAYANANLGFALDYEDMLHYVLHPGHATIAAGLAVAEDLRASGRDLLAAIVLGYEVGDRIAVAIQPTAERGAQVWGEGYHSLPAVVTAGKLLGLDEEELDVALGIAAIYSCVPSVYKYFGPVAETRPMREVKQGWGWQSMAGVVAAMSAKRGFRGGQGVLDGEQGYWTMVGSDRCDFGRMVDGLGERWAILETEYKIHPSIGVNHPAFWATKGLVEDHRITPEEVVEVTVTTLWADLIGDAAPQAAVDAQFSLPYTVAATILGEPLGPGLYEDEKLAEPALQALLARTRLVHDPAADRAFFEEQRVVQTVEIALRDGRTLRRAVEFPRDKPSYGQAELEAKFEALASGVLDDQRRTRLREVLDALAELEDVSRLAALLA